MSTARKVLSIAGASVSAVALVGASAFLASGVIRPSFMSYSESRSAAQTRNVDQVNSSMYCPARMQLADTGNYGDSDFQASAGDLSSSMRVGLMGALYQAQKESVNHTDTSSLLDNKTMSNGDVHTVAGDAGTSSVLSTRTLAAQKFTGAAGTVLSWATQADLRGLSAASCVPFSSSQSFLIPPTDTGWSQQLIVANASDKSTSVQLKAYGSGSAEELKFETHATATVAAHAETTIDLSAAFDVKDAAFVTVTSNSAPVAAVIQAVHMNGLVPQGSDYIVPVSSAAVQQVIPAVDGVRQGRLAIHAASRSGSARLSFVGAQGEIEKRDVEYNAGQLSVSDFDAMPQGTQAIVVTSTTPVVAALYDTGAAASDGQNDFSMTNGHAAQSAYAVAVPDGASATIDVTNILSDSQDVHVAAFNADGQQVGNKDISLASHSVAQIQASDLGSGVALVQISQKSKGASALVVGQSFSMEALSKAQVTARATSVATSMDLSTAQYTITHKHSVLN